MSDESEVRACVRCGTPVNIIGQCPRCLDKRPEIEQTHDPVQGLPHRPFSHCPAPERGDTKWPDQGAYIDPAPKTPETLAEVVGELEDVAELVKHGTLGSIKMKELRQKVIKAAITVKGCASTWEFEREYRPGMNEPPKHLFLFFGPSVADDRVTKEMKRTGTLPESKMDDRINQLMREGWRVVFRHYDPSFHVEQWRVILEKS